MPSDDPGSISRWLKDLKGGDPDAAELLWRRYFDQLVCRAHEKLRRRRTGAEADEEDAALSAFDSFCRGAAAGPFPPAGRPRRPLAAAGRPHRAQGRRQGGAPVAGSGAAGRVRARPTWTAATRRRAGRLDRFAGPEPTPEFAAMVAEEFRPPARAAGRRGAAADRHLEDGGLHQRRDRRRLGCARRTVARRLELIRTLWRAEPLRLSHHGVV